MSGELVFSLYENENEPDLCFLKLAYAVEEAGGGMGDRHTERLTEA